MLMFSFVHFMIQPVLADSPQNLSPPMVISGSVTLNGTPTPDDSNLTAWDNGIVVGFNLTMGGQYSIEVCGSPDVNCNPGDTISFKLNGQLTSSQTAQFSIGTITSMDLSFTGELTNAGTTASTTVQQQATTMVTSVVSTTTTPEYQSFTIISIIAVLFALGILAGRKRTSTR